jgi:hypothetical protein
VAAWAAKAAAGAAAAAAERRWQRRACGGGGKKWFLRFLNFDVKKGGRLSGRPNCSRRFLSIRFLLQQSYLLRLRKCEVTERPRKLSSSRQIIFM